VVLQLPLNTSSPIYGNSDPQTVEIFRLDTSLVSSKAYYSDTNLAYNKTPIATVEVTSSPYNSSGYLRIPMNSARNSWARNLFNTMSNSNWDSVTASTTNLNGFYVTPSNPLQLPGQGGIWNLNITSTSGGVYFYAHNSTDTVRSFFFPVGGSEIYFNHFDHNYSTAPFYNRHPSGKLDSINAPAFVYIQAMAGVEGKITFPYLKNWAKLKPVLINKAEVDLPVVAQDANNPALAPPSQLFLLGIDSLGHEYSIPDEYSSFSYYGGSYDQTNQVYVFNITQYVQQVINGKIMDRGLYIVPGNSATSANRVVLYGSQNSSKITLKMYYTPLKK
jgi:hypothetical protein